MMDSESRQLLSGKGNTNRKEDVEQKFADSNGLHGTGLKLSGNLYILILGKRNENYAVMVKLRYGPR